jgi:diphosphomevalonate decarboxylase
VAVATACANIALVKYWGKRDLALNLPARGSLSLTLDALRTFTEVTIAPGASEDEVTIDGRRMEGRARARVSEFLDRVRSRAAPALRSARARVVSKTTFPIAAGLASSASGFAALAVAADRTYGLGLSGAELSRLAREGSGSAARSIFGGFVRMEAGTKSDGSDAIARPFDGVTFELCAAIAVAGEAEKEVGSTDGMEATRATSPYHAAWLDQVDRDLALAERALRARDFHGLAEVVEGSCLAMHANAMAARPGIVYLRGPTLWAIDRVRTMRREGVPVMFTIDAGPHLVAFTPPEHLDRVARALEEHPEIEHVIRSRAGEAAHLIDRLPEGP